jgi:hypothetical protein
MDRYEFHRKFFWESVTEYFEDGIEWGVAPEDFYSLGNYVKPYYCWNSDIEYKERETFLDIPLFGHCWFDHELLRRYADTGQYISVDYHKFALKKIRENSEVLGISTDKHFKSWEDYLSSIRWCGLYYTLHRFLSNEKNKERFSMELNWTFPYVSL